MTVGDRIKERREYLGISQIDLAKRIHVLKQTLYKYETNITTNIPSDKIEEIAKILNVSPCYLMGWENKEESPKIMQYYERLNDIGKHEAEKRVAELTHLPQYTLEIKAAHNDHIDEPGELERMQKDIANLKRPDSDT